MCCRGGLCGALAMADSSLAPSPIVPHGMHGITLRPQRIKKGRSGRVIVTPSKLKLRGSVNVFFDPFFKHLVLCLVTLEEFRRFSASKLAEVSFLRELVRNPVLDPYITERM